jgi:serine/threonine protein kinase
MVFQPAIPKSALNKYVPIKIISQSENGSIIACVPKSSNTPTLSSLMALKVLSPGQGREALLVHLETLDGVDTERVTSVIDWYPKGNWYINSFQQGQNVEYLKDTLFRDGFPPFLVCKIFTEIINAQNMELEPKNICHADLRASNIILSPTTKTEWPDVRIVHLEGITGWNEQAVVSQVMGLLQYLTNSKSRIPDDFRTNKKGKKLKDSTGRSLQDGDELYSCIAGHKQEGRLAWRAIKSRWRILAGRLIKELHDKGWSADVREILWEEKVTDEELRNRSGNQNLDSCVALKILRGDNVTSVAEKLLKQLQGMESKADHIIAAVLKFPDSSHPGWHSMNYVAGCSIQQLLDKKYDEYGLAPTIVLHVLAELIRVQDHLETDRLTHADLAAGDNVMLSNKGRDAWPSVTLVDFSGIVSYNEVKKLEHVFHLVANMTRNQKVIPDCW